MAHDGQLVNHDSFTIRMDRFETMLGNLQHFMSRGEYVKNTSSVLRPKKQKHKPPIPHMPSGNNGHVNDVKVTNGKKECPETTKSELPNNSEEDTAKPVKSVSVPDDNSGKILLARHNAILHDVAQAARSAASAAMAAATVAKDTSNAAKQIVTNMEPFAGAAQTAVHAASQAAKASLEANEAAQRGTRYIESMSRRMEKLVCFW